MKRIITITLLPLSLLVFMVLFLTSAWLYTYHRLSAETLIAEVQFDAIGEQRYRARLATGDRCHSTEYLMYGDQWRLDAQFVKWKTWATLLGLEAQYRLERLEGRYLSIEDENTKIRKAYDIAGDTVVDLAEMSRRLGKMNFLMDAEYGSSTYHDMRSDVMYLVYKTHSGIMTRQKPRLEARIAPQGITITIDRACAEGPSAWERYSAWLNRVLISSVRDKDDPGPD
jgi:hypothetical protein